MSKLTDTQLVTLSAASQREDRGVVLPPNLKGGAAQKLVAKLIELGLVEEIRARGDLPVWRRDDDNRPMALRITKRGLKAIAVEDDPDDNTGARISRPPSKMPRRPTPPRRSPARRKPLRQGRGEDAMPPRHGGQSRGLQAGPDHCAPAAAGRDDNRGHHEGHGMAAALGARLLRGRGSQEARADAGLGEDRR